MSSSSANNDETSAAATVRAEKQVLRKEIRAKLKKLSKSDIDQQSHQVWDKLTKLPAFQSATSVGLFLSMPHSEISTEAILRECVAQGKDIYVPQVGANFEKAHMEMVKVVLETDSDRLDQHTDKKQKRTSGSSSETTDAPLFYESWPKNKWQIPEPPASMPLHFAQAAGDIDLLIVPGLAFDHDGNRLGQGKGYYDRFLERMNIPSKIAVCLDCQLLEKGKRIPTNHYDQPMEMILSPQETLSFPRKKELKDE